MERRGLRAAEIMRNIPVIAHKHTNLPAVTREAPRQLRTSRKNLSIFQTLGRRAVPCTLAGGAVLCCSAFTSVHAYSRDWEKKGGRRLSQHLGQRSSSATPRLRCAHSAASSVRQQPANSHHRAAPSIAITDWL